MATRLIMDKGGRIVIPRALRARLRLEPGDFLELDSVGDCITLRPIGGDAPLRKEHGVWVYRCGQPLAAEETEAMLERIRAERSPAPAAPRK